jgi:hypothetical protein
LEAAIQVKNERKSFNQQFENDFAQGLHFFFTRINSSSWITSCEWRIARLSTGDIPLCFRSGFEYPCRLI